MLFKHHVFRVFKLPYFYLRRIFPFILIFLIVLFSNTLISYYSYNYEYGEAVATRISKNIPIVYERQLYLDIEGLANYINTQNKDEKITNTDVFGAITEDTTVFVILIDKISDRLNYIITSLSRIRGIEEVLVIFSHAFIDEEINKLIRSIDFCRVWQIYYPYSIQTHPQEFPGHDPNDCSEESKYSRANCTGSLFRDVRGHFRNPYKTERKHHWWWTANSVFENFSSTARHTGLVIFLEDNFIFMNDFIYMASYMRDIAKSLPQCEFLSLGSDSTPADLETKETNDFYTVKLKTWNPKEHSRILAFDKSVWDTIVSHYDLYCSLDDASWLRSLYFISVHRRDAKSFKAISAVTPRAYKIDSCSDLAYFFSRSCNVPKNVLTITNMDHLNYENWFPSHLELYVNVELDEDDDVIFDYSEGDGGWADPRDWALCRNMTAGKIKKILMEMRNEFHEYFDGKS